MRTTNIAAVLVAAIGIAVVQSTYAAKTYTPAQLRKMVSAGTLPKQGSPSVQKQSAPFLSCVSKVKEIIASVGSQYPASKIVDTSIIYTVKLWTNDAAMTMTCSDPDQLLVITTAKYE